MPVMLLVAGLALAAWLWLWSARGGWWRADVRLDPEAPLLERWPPVAVVVPARDEAEVIGAAIASLLGQEYPGPLGVILVDDESTDGTADVARGAANAHGHDGRLEVVSTPPRPDGWIGKTWAMHVGAAHAEDALTDSEYLLLTDADVVHPTDSVRRLVAKAEAERLDLVSLMVKLEVHRPIEALLIPAFVYFFQMLYPFRRVNDPRRSEAAAAGGCILVRCEALARAGGIAAIRGEVIDDCALARAVKRKGPIWLGLADRARSVRSYGGLRGVWSTVARTAYTQLNRSPFALIGTVLGMALLYLVPPLAVVAWPLHRDAWATALGGAAWLVMARTFAPTLRLYGCSPARAFALPLAGVLYTAMTIDSARRHARGRGAEWKGRFAAGSGE